MNKLPPQATEIEDAVLGAMMLDNDSLQTALDLLKPDSFYKEANSRIFNAMKILHNSSSPVDVLTVMQQVKKTNELDLVGGALYITSLTGKTSSLASTEYNCRIIQQKYLLRQIIMISSEATREAYASDSDCFEVMSNLEKGVTNLSKDLITGKVETMASLWNQTADKNSILLQKKGISGIPSGYQNVDSITGGWQQPDLIILAARPAMGKTSLACNFARNAAVDFNKPGLIFSLEMSSIQIASRIFSMESGIPISQFQRRGIDPEQFLAAQNTCAKLINSNLFIDDTAGITLTELRSKARKLKRQKGIEWMVIDYLQLMSGDKGAKGMNREQEISTISRGVKSLAKELKIPIIALSQLSRAVESRGGDKKPQLSDLRESGAIEQDADIVLFLHRPEYYGVTQYEDGSSTAGEAELIFAKHRNGATGSEVLRFVAHLTKFENLNPSFGRDIKDYTQPISANDNWENEGKVI